MVLMRSLHLFARVVAATRRCKACNHSELSCFVFLFSCFFFLFPVLVLSCQFALLEGVSGVVRREQGMWSST